LKHYRSILALAAVGSLLTACSQGQSAPPVVNTVNNGSPNYSKLQLAVGTANVAGTLMLNVVSTLRQPDGMSADLVDSPNLTVPFSLGGQTPGTAGGPDGYSTAFSSGPAPMEIAGSKLMSTPQSVHLGAPPCPSAGAAGCDPGEQPNVTTFGQSGGVFGMGLQPANNTTNGTAYSYVPYTQPIFDSGNANAFVPWGGPPAFDDSNNGMGTRDGLHNLGAGLLGWNTGVTIFAFPGVAPGSYAGQYQLSAVIPTGPSTTATVSQSANLRSTAMLPNVTAPTLTLDGKGGGTFSGVTLPAGATEGYITIVDYGSGGSAANGPAPNCQGVLGTQNGAVYYTIEVVPGTTTYTLPDTIGPNTTQTGPTSLNPSESICTGTANSSALGGPSPGDTYTVQFFAMDYPLYEASYPKNKSQAPTLVGPSGQSDITISAPASNTSP
jgi:hypothetical protein